MDSDRIEGSAKAIGGNVEEAVGRFFDDNGMRASGIARQIEGEGQNLYGQAKDSLRNAREQVDRTAQVTGHLADRAFDEGERYVRRATSQASRNIAEQPLISVLLAAALGFVAGILVRHK